MTAPRAYYNEHDPYVAQWLRNLIAAGLVMEGEVDERSIVDVRPADVAGYARCHFFAGIAGWDLALQLAGWPAERPVWTGSCPCQPFSAAGRRGGFADERHLWPAWFALIRDCRPATIFGEQVEAAVRLGWLDAVLADLEGQDYACGAAVLGAHSVGAPHIRQRLWFVADVLSARLEGRDARSLGHEREAAERGGATGGLGDAERIGLRGAGCGRDDGASGSLQGENGQREWLRSDARAAGFGSPWFDTIWLPCRDGKARPTQLGLQPLAHGVPARVGKLRAAGNAIVPQTAATFVGAYLAAAPGTAPPAPQPHPPTGYAGDRR